MQNTTSSTDALEWLKGMIERITFYSEETGFCVFRVKVSGQSELKTVIGNAASIQAGEFIECQGSWVNDKKHGLQFRANHLKITPPTSLEGIEKYLASGMIKGIGEGFAQRLIRVFKEKVFDVIENEPERLREVEGIGDKRKKGIIEAWAKQRVVRDIMIFLHGHGVGTSRAVRIYKTYGNESINKIKENPYSLAQDIHGIGFKSADQLARNLGIAKNSQQRIRAGVTYGLQEYSANGHCGIQKETLVQHIASILEVTEDLVLRAIEDEIANESIIELSIQEKPCIFLRSLYQAEKGIAQHCQRLTKTQTPWQQIDCEKAIDWVQNKTQIILSESQRKAVATALGNKVSIITGGPGVGKTTIVNSIVKIVGSKARVLLTAPTGRAAKRLAESTGSEAKTIHRLLEFDPKTHQFKRNADFRLEVDLLVVDESSMVDVVLMNQLLRALPDEASLLLVGDVDQLPSVGPGMVLKDLIDSNGIVTVRLKEIFRQAATSKIITNAHRINQGIAPESGKKDEGALSDFYFIECDEPEEIKHKIVQLVAQRIPARFAIKPLEIQILTPTRKGGLGTVSLNIELQKHLNPQKDVVEKYGNSFGVGDKVIQTVNNYDKEVFNGDIGTVARIDLEESLVWIKFDDRLIEYEFSELDEINLAYAVTVHKSQGSEYPVVVIPISMQHYNLLERNLIYTAVTRGKKLVVIVGQKKALTMAVKRLQAQKRVTYLKYLLYTHSE